MEGPNATTGTAEHPPAPKRRAVSWEEVRTLLHDEQVHNDEFERRFELAGASPELLEALAHAPYRVISQGYFDAVENEGEQEVRYRLRARAAWDAKTGERYVVNTKEEHQTGTIGKENRETQWHIEAQEFMRTWAYTYNPENEHAFRISKVRFYVQSGEHCVELDVFLEPARVRGLVLAEVEFPNPEAMSDFDPAQAGLTWLGPEVSDIKALSNKRLAARGLPDEEEYTPASFEGKNELVALAQSRLNERAQSETSLFAVE